MQPTNTPKRKGISIHDFGKDRMVYFKNPYGAKAKKAYKKYIDAGYEPWMVLPPDLRHHPPSYTSFESYNSAVAGMRLKNKF
eukprot:SAG11_NODE_401_length_9759_cov_119.937992_8_plen_82_part_00